MSIQKKKKSEKSFLPDTIGIPEGYSIKNVGTSQSLMLKFLACRKAWLYSLNKVRSYGVTERTNFGSLFHFVLDKVYTNGKIPNAAMIKVFIEEYVEENKEALQRLDLQKLEKDIAVCQVVAEEYFLFYQSDFTDKKFTDVEQEITAEILGYKLHCKIDGRYKDPAGFIWNMEHKTKGRISEDNLMKKLSFDTQNLVYVLASEQFYREKIHGVLYNIVRSPQLKLGKTETLKAFCERLKLDIKERKDFYFMRYEIPYTENDKEKAVSRFSAILGEMENCCTEKQQIFENTGNCEALYACEFLDACMSNSFEGYAIGKKVFSELKSINY